jgi:two-component system response regulator AtoC
MVGALLLVDEDPSALRATAAHFGELGYEVFRETGLAAAVATFERTRPDVVILGLHLPGPSSAALFEAFRRRGAALVLVLGHGFRDAEVRAMQLDAEQILRKPLEMAHLEAVTARVLERSRTRLRNAFLRSRLVPDPGPDTLGVSAAMRALTERLRSLARAEGGVVLLTGEPGTGKGWAARLIHATSPRADGPFIEVACAAPGPSLERELFGAEAGVEGAGSPRRPGLFELADGGTLFLDEFLVLPAAVQPAVVEAMGTRLVRRAGGEQPISVNVRPVAATSGDVGAAIRQGRLREDLFYRLDVIPVHLPPLREREREDREALAARLTADLAVQMPGCPGALSAEARDRLAAYAWPGNIREMRNVLERALLDARGATVLEPEHLPAELGTRPVEPPRQVPQSLEDVERRHIERTLRRHGGNRTHAAEELGISRATLINKIRTYALNV